jgi:hypothetical protein
MDFVKPGNQVYEAAMKLEKLASGKISGTNRDKIEFLNPPDVTPEISRSESEDTCDIEVKKRGDHDIEPIDIIYTGEPGTVEPTTGIAFPASLNGYEFIGCGVRTKYLFFHAYAIGVYFDVEPTVLQNIKTDEDISDFLLDPKYPRVFRLVLNRDVTSNQYTNATFEALAPRMRGKDMDK